MIRKWIAICFSRDPSANPSIWVETGSLKPEHYWRSYIQDIWKNHYFGWTRSYQVGVDDPLEALLNIKDGIDSQIQRYIRWERTISSGKDKRIRELKQFQKNVRSDIDKAIQEYKRSPELAHKGSDLPNDKTDPFYTIHRHLGFEDIFTVYERRRISNDGN